MQVLLAFTFSYVNSIYFHAPGSVGNFKTISASKLVLYPSTPTTDCFTIQINIGFTKIRCQHQYYSLQLLAKIVMRSLMLQFRREMGLKSLTVSGLLIFGTKVMKELLMLSKIILPL